MADSFDNYPYSEQYRLAAKAWVQAEAAANLLEETKTSVLAQRKSALGDISDAKAERIVKASSEWMDFIQKMCGAREAANLAKVRLKFIETKYWERNDANATARAEMRLSA